MKAPSWEERVREVCVHPVSNFHIIEGQWHNQKIPIEFDTVSLKPSHTIPPTRANPVPYLPVGSWNAWWESDWTIDENAFFAR